MPYKHLADKQAWTKRYRASHQEAFRRYSKAYVLRHPKRRKSSVAKYYQANKDKKALYEKGRRYQHRIDCRKSYMKNPETSRRYYIKNKERFKEYGWRLHLKRQYGLSTSDYEALIQQQDGKCAICGNGSVDGKKLHIDHDHQTKRVRGLLCRPCNKGLGFFRDNLKLLVNAIEYLCKE